MRHTIILLILFLASCKDKEPFVQSRLKTADKFLECLKQNRPNYILDYTYHDVDYKISEKQAREFYVDKASQFIKKFGLPPKEKWIVNYDPKNNFERLIITIPLFKGYDTAFRLLKASLVLTFPPPQISSKIYRYDIDAEYEPFVVVPPKIEPQWKNNPDTVSSK